MKLENDLREHDIRPVTDKDTWCRGYKNGNGYIITIPYFENKTLFKRRLYACIVRVKKQGNNILVQLVEHNVCRYYKIYSYTPICSKAILNIKNLNKH